MYDKINIVSNRLTRQLKLKVADIIIEARCADSDTSLIVSKVNQRFLVEDGQPDCILNVHYGPLPDMELGETVFDSGGGPWRLYRYGEKLVYQLVCNINGQRHAHRLAIFEPDFNCGELFICPMSLLPIDNQIPSEKQRLSLNPFTALDELLIVILLAMGRGIHTHALGVVYKGRCLVFCGFSGAGKSTLARLWKKRDVRLLSDDRISLRKKDGIIWAYGTPWHGDARISLPERAPVEAIYFIVHGKENQILPLCANEVATRLMVRCFPTFYLKQGMEYALSFIAELAQLTPCYELQFTPDERAVDKVINHVESYKL